MFRRLTVFEAKLQIRNFFTVFFTFMFPIMMLVLFGTVYGNEPSEYFGGRGTVDMLLPAYICQIVSVTGLMALPLTLASYREQRILKRFMATPIRPTQILLAQLVVNGVTALAGIGALFLVAKLVFKVTFLGGIVPFMASLLLVVFSVYGLGLVIAGVTNTGRAASTMAYIIYFPMLFLSGASMPLEIMPPGLQNFSKVFPLTYGVKLLSGVWHGEPLQNYYPQIIVLLALSAISGFLAAKFFKWE